MKPMVDSTLGTSFLSVRECTKGKHDEMEKVILYLGEPRDTKAYLLV